ncbi:hypothetical protein ACFL0J_06930 [Candidatus Neomarinimicrobiota bacterium]
MSKIRKLFIFIIFSTFIIAQNKDDVTKELIVFRTTDYKSYIGSIENEFTDSTSIKTYNGDNYTFVNSEILFTFPFTGRVKNGRLQKRDPNSSFYLFSPSAFAIESGKIYCRDFCLFYPSLNFGLANIVSAQAGLFWYPGMDYENTPFVGNLKLTAFETNIFSLAAGITYVNLPVIQKERIYSTGFAFITGTFGNRYNHASVSAGLGYVQKESEWVREDKPIIVAAGNLRLLNSVSFVTENWFFPDEKSNDSLISVALRFFGRQIAVDVGATFTVNSIQEKVNPIPVINFTYHLR